MLKKYCSLLAQLSDAKPSRHCQHANVVLYSTLPRSYKVRNTEERLVGLPSLLSLLGSEEGGRGGGSGEGEGEGVGRERGREWGGIGQFTDAQRDAVKLKHA